jgi:formamidopyrimidine-DNA glycosylase
MACCGGSRPQSVRKQTIEAAKKQSAGPVQKRISRSSGQSAQAASPQRQYVMARDQCTKCGYPLMAITIRNRERMQCSNANCRKVAE